MENRTSLLNRWAQALAGVARTGLAYTKSNYEKERYQEVLSIAADIAAKVDKGEDLEVTPDWINLSTEGLSGYVTPKVAVGAVVGNEHGQMLLIQRSDSGHWLYPTGWVDIGYSPSEVVVKEVKEETGIDCEVLRLIAVYDGLRAGFSYLPLISLVFLCQMRGGSLEPHPEECLDLGWFSRHELPQPLANFELWGELAFASISGERRETYFDAVRQPVWDGDPTRYL